MFASLVIEPIEDSGELNEAQKRSREFIVAGGDAAMALDSAEEVFDAMAATVVAAVEGVAPSAPAPWSDTGPNAGLVQRAMKRARIKALIGHDVRVF